VIADIATGGTTSMRAIAADLNIRGTQTRRGERWHASHTGNLLVRLGVQGTY